MQQAPKVSLELSPAEKNHVDNLIRLLAKAQASLNGVEILAAAESMRWLSAFQAKLTNAIAELNKPAVVQSVPELEKQSEEKPKTLRESAKGKKDANVKA